MAQGSSGQQESPGHQSLRALEEMCIALCSAITKYLGGLDIYFCIFCAFWLFLSIYGSTTSNIKLFVLK